MLAELLQRDARVTDVVVDPALGLGPSGYELVLDELAAAGADKQVVVVTGDTRFVSWAIEQPGRLVEVVPAAAVDPRAERRRPDRHGPSPVARGLPVQ